MCFIINCCQKLQLCDVAISFKTAVVLNDKARLSPTQQTMVVFSDSVIGLINSTMCVQAISSNGGVELLTGCCVQS